MISIGRKDEPTGNLRGMQTERPNRAGLAHTPSSSTGVSTRLTGGARAALMQGESYPHRWPPRKMCWRKPEIAGNHLEIVRDSCAGVCIANQIAKKGPSSQVQTV